MAMTMTQKILAAHAGKDQVQAGELILVRLDRVPWKRHHLSRGHS